MARIISDSGDSRISDKRRSARRRHRVPWRVATAGLAVAAAAVLLLLGAGQPASATAGVYNAAIDVNTTTGGVQECLPVSPGETFSINVMALGVDASDSDNFVSLGNVGINYPTGAFTSPNINIAAGDIAAQGDANFFPVGQGSTTAKEVGFTHVARAYADPNVTGTALSGDIIMAPVTLTAAGSGQITIGITKTTPVLDGSWDTFMGGVPNVQPTSIQTGVIDIGGTCAPPVNNPPDAVDDGALVWQDSTDNVIDVLANDSDPDAGDTLTITNVTDPPHGTAVISGGGTTVTYTPDAGYNGGPPPDDDFDYTISDGQDTDTATVTVSISGQPTANDDTIPVAEDSVDNVLDPLANDTDPDNDELTIVSIGAAKHGVAVLSGDKKTVTYTPDPDFYGLDFFIYQVKDPSVLIDSGTVFLQVGAVNDPPNVTAPTAITVPEDGANTEPTTITDIDDTNFTCAVKMASEPTHGDVTFGANCSDVTYTATDLNYNGADSFTFTVTDSGGDQGAGFKLSDDQAVAVTITAVGDPPDAVDDTESAVVLVPTVMDVLLNDSDPDGDTLTIISVGTPSHGGAVISGGGTTVTYTSDAAYFGPDSFDYTISDGDAGTADDTATVNVTVTSNPPVADDKAVSTDEETAKLITLTATDPDQDCPLTFEIVSPPSDGTLGSIGGETCTAGVASAEVTYTPDTNYSGPDSFTYTAADASGAVSDPATVSITVNPINDPPDVTGPTSMTVPEDGANTESTTISDVDDTVFTCAVKTAPTKGNVTFGANCSSVTYTATMSDVYGPDAFTFTVTDSGNDQGAGFELSDDQEVVVTITPVNDAPSLTGIPDISFPEEGSDSSTNLDTYYSDIETAAADASFSVTLCPTGLTCSINAATHVLTVSGNTDVDGIFNVTVEATDRGDPDDCGTPGPMCDGPLSDSDTLQVEVTPVNDPPDVTGPASMTVPEDGQATESTTITDVDDTVFTCAVKTAPAHGSVTFGANCSGVTYTATDLNYNGGDSFTFTVTDSGNGQGAGFELSDDQAVSVTITPVNDPPVCQDVPLTTDEDIQGSTEPDCSDVEGDTLTFQIVDQPANGTASVGSLLYDPNPDFFGDDSFTYKANDGTADSDPATVHVTVEAISDPPNAVDDTATVQQNSTDNPIDVLANDSDPDGDELTIVDVSDPANGTATINDNGTPADPSDDFIDYTPDADFVGEDTFTYTIMDETERDDTAKVTVTVNAPPVAKDDSATVDQDSADNVIDVLANDSDPDGDALTVTGVTDPANGSAAISADGSSVLYTPDAGFSGTDTFDYTISDGNGGTDTATVTITVAKALEIVEEPTPTPSPGALPVTGGPGSDTGGLTPWAIIDVLAIIVAGTILMSVAVWHQWALRTRRSRRE